MTWSADKIGINTALLDLFEDAMAKPLPFFGRYEPAHRGGRGDDPPRDGDTGATLKMGSTRKRNGAARRNTEPQILS